MDSSTKRPINANYSLVVYLLSDQHLHIPCFGLPSQLLLWLLFLVGYIIIFRFRWATYKSLVQGQRSLFQLCAIRSIIVMSLNAQEEHHQCDYPCPATFVAAPRCARNKHTSNYHTFRTDCVLFCYNKLHPDNSARENKCNMMVTINSINLIPIQIM